MNFWAIIIGVATFAAAMPTSADMVMLFSASDDPGAAPDATSGVDVWTFSGTGNVVLFNSSSSNNANIGPAWGINSAGGGAADTAQIDASLSSLAGFGLGAGSVVSIDFENGSVGSAGSVGVQFLSAGSVVSEFSFLSGGSDYLLNGTSTGIGFTTAGLNLSLAINDNIGGYGFSVSDLSGTQLFNSGGLTFNGGLAPDSIRVFNNSTGVFSGPDLFVNNLGLKAVAIPEPLTLTTFGLGLAMLCRRRRS